MADPKTQLVITAKDETAAAFASATRGVTQLSDAYGKLTGILAGAGVAGSLLSMVKGTIEANDHLQKMSQKTGIAVESLSALKYAGELSGIGLEAMATSFKKLSVNMNETAATGKGNAAEAFKAIGVSVTDSSGKLRGADAVMGDVADRFQGMEDGAGKAALAVAIFGKAGTELIPLLNGGAAGLKKAADEAKKFGLIVSGDVAAASEKFNDDLRRMTLGSEALGKSIVADLIGPLSKMIELMVDAKRTGAGFFTSMAVGLRMDDPKTQTLDELRERAASRVNRLSMKVGAGSGAFPGMKARDDADRAELAILQAEIALRLKNQSGYQGQVRASDNALIKTEAPKFGGKDNSDREAAYLASLRNQLHAASGDVSEYSKQLEAIASGPAKDFSQTTKNSALALAQKIDKLKEATKTIEDHAKVLEKVWAAEQAAGKTVSDFSFKQGQGVGDITTRTAEIGRTPYEISQMQAARRIEKDYEEAVKKVNEELGKIGDIEGISAKTYALTQERDKAHVATTNALAEEKAAQDRLNASWEYGADSALRKYADEVANVAASTEQMMTRAFKGMEDALVNFVKTGKLDFKSLADNIITDLIRIQVQNSIMKPLVGTKDDPGILSQGLSWIGSSIAGMFGGGRASGGAVLPGQYYVVGENGPEILVPNAGGTVIPNGGRAASGGQSQPVSINFNVSAIDAASFRSTLAANRNVIIGVVREAYTRRAITSPI